MRYHTYIGFLKQRSSLFLSFFMAASGIEVENHASQSVALHSSSDSRARALEYLETDFSVSLRPSALSDRHISEIADIQSRFEELREISVLDQRIGNLSRRQTNIASVGWQNAREITAKKFDSIMEAIGSFSLVNSHEVRSRVNGRVPMTGVSKNERDLSAVLFVLNHQELSFSTTRMLIEHIERVLSSTDTNPAAWGEIAEKIDSASRRFSPDTGEQVLHTLPPWMRLMVYAQRLGTHSEDTGYYADIEAQSYSLATFDSLVRALRRRANDGASVSECKAIIQRMTELPFLHAETGALRLKGDVKNNQYPVERRMLFLLSSIRAVGIEAADMIRLFMGSQLFVSRNEYGLLPSVLKEVIEDVAYERGMKKSDRMEELIQKTEDTVGQMGRERQNIHRMVVYSAEEIASFLKK